MRNGRAGMESLVATQKFGLQCYGLGSGWVILIQNDTIDLFKELSLWLLERAGRKAGRSIR
jgi:hypothetical protein